MATAGTDLTQAAAAFVDAFDRADWDTFRGFIADGAVYSETGTGRRVLTLMQQVGALPAP